VGSGAKPTILVHFHGEGTLLVACKVRGLKHQKTAFTFFYEKVFQELTSSI